MISNDAVAQLSKRLSKSFGADCGSSRLLCELLAWKMSQGGRQSVLGFVEIKVNPDAERYVVLDEASGEVFDPVLAAEDMGPFQNTVGQYEKVRPLGAANEQTVLAAAAANVDLIFLDQENDSELRNYKDHLKAYGILLEDEDILRAWELLPARQDPPGPRRRPSALAEGRPDLERLEQTRQISGSATSEPDLQPEIER
jgi:hypothetical protein